MFDVPYVWPYCALAARYKEDSGDNDNDPFDFIDDLIEKWLPGANITKLWEPKKLDFTYAIEHDGKLLTAFLGTEGKLFEAGWESDFSPQIERRKRFKELGGHVDFIQAGERAGDRFADLVRHYRGNTLVVGHSRGGPRCMAAARWWYRNCGQVIPERIIPFCSPPVFNADAADEYDKCGLGSVTIRPTMSNDPVDILGLPFLKHVGTELKLPKIETKAIKKHGLVGKLAYGHAYSSIFESLIYYCDKYELKTEAQWLRDTQWVATV